MPEWLQGLDGLQPGALYVLAAVLVAAETALIFGLFLPGESVLLFMGFLASVGVLDLGPTIVFLTVAALAGDSLAYLLGRRFGPRLRTTRFGQRVGERRWRRAEELLQRSGGRAILIGKWIAFVRTLIPALAGASGMSYRRFLAWDALAVAMYVPGSVLIGYIAGESYLELERAFGRATGAVLLLAAGVAGLIIAGRWLVRRPDPARSLARYLGQLPPLRWAEVRLEWYSRRFGTASARAVNVAFGIAAMFLFSWGVAVLAQRVVRTSGLPLVDGVVVRWIEARSDPTLTGLAEFVVTTLRGAVAVAVVGIVAAVAAVRWRQRGQRHWAAPLGAFASLVVLGLTVYWAVPQTTPPTGDRANAFFPTGHVIVTASIGLLVWMGSRNNTWARKVGAATAGAVALLLVTAGRLYLGANWPSEAAASVLVGIVWDLVIIATWRSWERTTPVQPLSAQDHSHATPSPSRSRPAR